ncbi:hypothetical protein AB0I68_16715 [Streptomyces sp. NPDC050448]|uniref:hypothetical protein n=1 Tax=Streptomyces sp. NPDC050448 TaxID=3155404 RepID=UPI00342C869D
MRRRAPNTAYGRLFDLPGETLDGRRFPHRTCAVYQVTRNAELVWMVREVGGERRQVGSHGTTRKGVLALAVGAVAHEREKAAAAPETATPATGDQGNRARGTAWSTAAEGGECSQVSATMTERLGHRKPEWSLLERWPATVPGPDHGPRAGRQYPAVADWGLSLSA